MRELPIIFSGPMVCAILENRKTQTRRINFNGEVGDRLWVREALRMYMDHLGWHLISYAVDEEETRYRWEWANKGLPAMFMPKSLARIWLEVTAVREELLQDILDKDARLEGFADALEFAGYWDTLYYERKPQYRWVENPIVQVITFKRDK